jgi:hypothetical protein
VSYAPAASAETVSKSLCIYDPSGTGGDAFQNAKAYATAALAWGVKFELKPYTEEAIAASDFRNKKCDAVMVTGARAMQFNKKSYSLEAIGGIEDYNALGTVMKVLSSPKAAGLMKSGSYETASVFPAGSIYLYVRDRTKTNVADLVGKKIATLDYDPAAKYMVSHVGATLEPADIGTFASKFNNGSVFACYAPSTAHGPLELERGLGSSGGIVKFTLAQLTLQVVIRSAEFPENFGIESRKYAAAKFPTLIAKARQAETDIPSQYWMNLPGDDLARYREMFGEVRSELVKKGVYDPTIVALLERIGGAK